MNQPEPASRSQFNAYRCNARRNAQQRYKKALTDANKRVGCSLTSLLGLRPPNTPRWPTATTVFPRFTGKTVREHSYDKQRNCALRRSSAARLEKDGYPIG